MAKTMLEQMNGKQAVEALTAFLHVEQERIRALVEKTENVNEKRQLLAQLAGLEYMRDQMWLAKETGLEVNEDGSQR